MLVLVLLACLSTTFKFAWAQECPAAEDILPCVCSQNIVSLELSLDCSNVLDDQELQAVFQANFPWKVFNAFTIRGKAASPVPLVYLADGLFGEVSFESIFIEYTDLNRVGDNVFESSYNTLYVLRIFHNKLTTFPTIALPLFSQLSFLDLSHNQLTYIQDLYSPTLQLLYLEENRGIHFSDNLLIQVPQLVELNMANCEIGTLSPNLFNYAGHLDTLFFQSNNITYLQSDALAFSNNTVTRVVLSGNMIYDVDVNFISGTSGKETIVMLNNQLTTLREEAWRPLFTKLADSGIGSVVLDDNPLGCDCAIAWLVTSPDLMRSLAVGAKCADGTILHELNPGDFLNCL